MGRRSTLAPALALGAVLVTSSSAATSVPYLRSAAVHRGHVAAVFRLGELAPGRIAVASKPSEQPNGAFVRANIRLDETMSHLAPVRGGTRVQTRHTLRPGRYYVKVSGLVIGLDCTPQKPCRTDWSNARRVVIPRPR